MWAKSEKLEIILLRKCLKTDVAIFEKSKIPLIRGLAGIKLLNPAKVISRLEELINDWLFTILFVDKVSLTLSGI